MAQIAARLSGLRLWSWAIGNTRWRQECHWPGVHINVVPVNRPPQAQIDCRYDGARLREAVKGYSLQGFLVLKIQWLCWILEGMLIGQEEMWCGGGKPAELHASFVSVGANYFTFPEGQQAVYSWLTKVTEHWHVTIKYVDTIVWKSTCPFRCKWGSY